MLLWSKYFLENNLAEVQEQSILVSNAKLSFTDEIDQVNKRLDEVAAIQAGYVTWSGILAEFSSIIPANVRIESLIFDAPNQSFYLKGFSRTRDDLLVLEKQLENSDLFININSPLSNLLNSRDIQFEFSGSINLGEKASRTE
jgi:Tfp pilus assembly protein PilN